MTGLRGTILRLLVSCGAIGLILFTMRDKIGEAWVILRTDVIWAWFGVGLTTYFCANAVIAARMMYVFQIHDIFLSFRKALYLAFLGLFFNLFLPSAIGGDVAKIYFASRYTGKKLESASAVFQDRLIGFVAIISMACIALMLFGHQISDARVGQVVYIFLGIMLFTVLFFGSRRFAKNFRFLHLAIPSENIKNKLRALYDTIYNFKQHPKILAKALLLAFIGQSGFIIVHYFLARSLGTDIGVGIFFLIVPIVAIVSMMPSLGGLGVREAGIIFFLKNYMAPERAMVLSLLLLIVIYGMSLFAGLLYALKGELRTKTIHDLEEAAETA